jgi:hypothetical protein
LRLNLCNKIDFGVAGQTALTGDLLFQRQFLFQIRWRF